MPLSSGAFRFALAALAPESSGALPTTRPSRSFGAAEMTPTDDGPRLSAALAAPPVAALAAPPGARAAPCGGAAGDARGGALHVSVESAVPCCGAAQKPETAVAPAGCANAPRGALQDDGPGGGRSRGGAGGAAKTPHCMLTGPPHFDRQPSCGGCDGAGQACMAAGSRGGAPKGAQAGASAGTQVDSTSKSQLGSSVPSKCMLPAALPTSANGAAVDMWGAERHWAA